MGDLFIYINIYFQMYDLAYYKAKEMLQRNRQVLEKIVEELMEFEILTGKVCMSHLIVLFDL